MRQVTRAATLGNHGIFPRALRIWHSLVRCLGIASEAFFPVSDTGGAPEWLGVFLPGDSAQGFMPSWHFSDSA